MCGIAGLLSTKIRDEQFTRILLCRWKHLLHHRGPDSWGWYQCAEQPLLLFHTRLAITGLHNGAQPLSNADGTIWLTFNGEIYNYPELKQDLQAEGYRFRTETDGEVIIHLFEKMGIECLQQLNGEFAFALYDSRNDQLFLARDRFGVKPLYYAAQPDAFYFASEIKGIFADESFPRRFDQETISQYLHTFYFDTPTAFEGVRQVKPGHYLRLNITSRQLQQQQYWQLPLGQTPTQTQESDLTAAFQHLLRSAIQLRIPREVPFGVYLSGGLDSSAITALAAETNGPFPVFSLGFNQPQYDESGRSAQLAKSLGLSRQLLQIGAGDLKQAFVDSIWHSEVPVLNTHGAAKKLLAQRARQQCKVVLTGEGADELLFGYALFNHLQSEENLNNNAELAVLKGQLSGRLKKYQAVIGAFGAYPYSMQRFFYLQKLYPWMTQNRFRKAIQVFDWKTDIQRQIDTAPGRGLNSLELTQHFFLQTDFPAYLLNYLGDRQEMSASLEGRVPFLDHRIAEFACRLPTDLKLRNGSGKYILREALRGRLPENLLQQPKQVFYAPAFDSLAYFKNADFFETYTNRKAFEAAGILNPAFFTFLKWLIRVLPTQHRLLPVVESLATFMLSLQILHHQYIQSFDERLRSAPQDIPGLSAPVNHQLGAGDIR